MTLRGLGIGLLLAPLVAGLWRAGLPLAQAATAPQPEVPGARHPGTGPAMPGPVLTLVDGAFQTMRSTHYQHHTEVDTERGIYGFDCVGLVSWALRKSTPQAWTSLVQRMAIAPGRIPSPPTLVRFLQGLHQRPAPGWQAVANVEVLQPGDVISWEHRSSHASGHALILASRPRRDGEGTWLVEVFDSTSTPHADDSRPSDQRALRWERTGRRSGLGHGVMALISAPGEGTLIGFRWRPGGPTVLAPVAAGRPLN